VDGKNEKIQNTLRKHKAMMLTGAPHFPSVQRRGGRLGPVRRRSSSVEMDTMYEVRRSEAEREATAWMAVVLPRLMRERMAVTTNDMKIALRGMSHP